MYISNQTANNFLNGNMGSLSAGKLRYAGWRGKMTTPRNFPQETAEPTSSGYLDMFRGGVRGLGAIDKGQWDEPHPSFIKNCDDFFHWFTAVMTPMTEGMTYVGTLQKAAVIEWAFQEGVRQSRAGNVGANLNEGQAICICPSNKLVVIMGPKTDAGIIGGTGEKAYIRKIQIWDGCNSNGKSTYLIWNRITIGNEDEYNSVWWDGDSNSIAARYKPVGSGNNNTPTPNWFANLCECSTSPDKPGCPPPCVLDEKGNCMKPCNGAVIPCDAPCEPEKPPTPPDTDKGGCCEICEATSKQGTTQFYLSKNKTDKSIPVMVRGKTIECTPKNPDKQYQWDCDQVMKQIQSYLGNSSNTSSGVGYLGFNGAIGTRRATAGQIATATAKTGCPCDCKEIDGQVQMYVNTNKTGEGDIPFTLPYTSVDCKGKGGLNPDGSPKDKIENLKINCDDIKNAIAQQGYSVSGLGDCGCGNCGQQGMGDLSGGQIAAYAFGAGIFSLALFYVFGNKIKEL